MGILSSIQSFFLENFVPFVILLGLLIFVHELGHFLVAKFFKVRVEVFSLGFGKKIIQFVRGHTTYCISLIPLGGYVKMYGDDPSAEIPKELEDVAFNRKPVGQRIAIVLAGPLMNFFFAILLFASIGLLGERVLPPVLGDIEKGSPAAELGFSSGDRIQSINDRAVSYWKEIEEKVEESIGEELKFKVERGSELVQVIATPKKEVNEDPLKWPDFLGQIEGLSPFSQASVIGVNSLDDRVAWTSGLQPLDRITAVNGEPVKLWRQLEEKLTALLGSDKVELTIERQSFSENGQVPAEGEDNSNNEIKISLDLSTFQVQETAYASLTQLGIESPEIYLSFLSEDMPAAAAGILPKDKILSISGKDIQSWDQVIETVNGYQEGSSALEFAILRSGEVKQFSIMPKINTFMNQNGQEEKRYQVGIGPAIYRTVDEFSIYQSGNLFEATSHGWDQTINWTSAISVSFVRMLQAEVSPKNIGGIVTIGQVASETFKAGLTPYLKIMAIISINLFILNLLPIPILDGGHLVFYTIEALRGAPVSMKKLEVAQQIGLIILMSLMAFALFNDFSRLWG